MFVTSLAAENTTFAAFYSVTDALKVSKMFETVKPKIAVNFYSKN
jgi:hypothetical protein